MMKPIRILLTSLVIAIGLTCLTQTVWAETETTLSVLMEVLKEDQKEASYNINLNAPFSKESTGIREKISTETGELTIRSELFHIPGRNGKDISLDLVYRSRDAKLYDEGTKCGNASNGYGSNIIALYDIFDSNGYWLRTGALKYTSSDTVIYSELSIGNELWTFTGYIQYEDGTTLMQESGIVNALREKSVLSASKHIFGEGWSIDMPSLILEGDRVYVTLKNGQTYQADFKKGMGIKDYELYDVIFTKDNSETISNETSEYKLYYVNGDTYWFSANGALLRNEDRFGNGISYIWNTIDGLKLLTKVEDSSGHEVNIDYQDKKITLKSGNRTYTLDKEEISGEMDRYDLVSITDPEGRKISYKYEFSDAQFDLISSTNAENKYANLVEVIYPTGARTKYSYLKSKKNLGQSGFMEYFKVIGRKDIEENSEKNVQIYKYYNEPDGYPTYNAYDISDNYRYYSESTDSKGLTTKHFFNGSHQQFFKEITGKRLFESIRTFYHLQNHLPEKIITSIYDEDFNIKKETDLYQYDYRGNLIYENHLFDEALAPEDAHKTLYKYDYTFNLMTEKSYRQDEATEIFETYTLGEDKKTIVEETLRSNNQLLKCKKYDYDELGNLIEMQTEEKPGVWSTVRYGYSSDYEQARLTSVTYEDVSDAHGLTSDIRLHYGYDFSTGERTWETDGNGNTTSLEYDKLGRLIKKNLPDGSERIYFYDDISNTATSTDACGNGIKYFYSELGNLNRVEDLTSEEILAILEYDSNDNLVKSYDGEGNYQTWGYDQLSRLVNTSNYDIDKQLLARTVISFDEVFTKDGITYHKVEVVKKGDLEDRMFIYLFDPYERLSILGRKTEWGTDYSSYAYDYLGNNITSIDFSGIKKSFDYDGLNRIVKVIDAEGNTSENIYDLAGNLIEAVDPIGNSVYYEYDSLGRNTVKRVPYDEKIYSTYRTFYDNNGNISAVVDPLGNTSRYEFNSRGLLTTVELGAGTNSPMLTRYIYDNEGRLEKAITGLDNLVDTDFAVESYEYDSMGRLVSQSDHGGNQTFYKYDSNGNILRKTDRNGVTTEYTYDGLNRIVSEKNTKDKEKGQIRFTYDLLGNTIKMSDKTGETSYGYDSLGRVSSIDYGNGMKQLYAYDRSDNVTDFTMEKNGISELDINYGYDLLGRLSTVENESVRYTYSYDKAGRLVEEENAYTGIKTSYEYFPSGNLKTLCHMNGSDIIDTYSYGYDRKGSMTWEMTEEGTTRYAYDHLLRLDTVMMQDGNIQQYQYDDFNNIIRLMEIQETKSGSSMIFENNFAYDINGRLISKVKTRGNSIEEIFFTYDSEGNQLTKELVLSRNEGQVLSQSCHFGYNGNNQLESFLSPDNIPTTYLYNAIGLRTHKTTGDETKAFYYNNGSIVLETDTNGQIVATNTRGLRLISRKTETDTLYYLHNAKGDVRKLTDGTGSIIKDYTYDPFGNGKGADANHFDIYGFNSQTAAPIDNPFMYSGEYLDDETGYYYLRARYYDPQVQRFITEDSYMGEQNHPFSLNGYSYCWNDPINYTDPNGKDPYSLYLMLTEYSQTIMSSPDSQLDMQLIADDVAQEDYLALALDIAGLLTPGTSGYGKYATQIRELFSKLGTGIDDSVNGMIHLFIKSSDDVADVLSKGGIETGQKLLNVGTKSDAIAAVKNLPEAIQSKVKDFYRGGSNAYNNFGVEQLENGNYLVQMTKPGNVPGSHATYFKEITETGETVITYKNTIDPLGNLVHTKIK